MSDRYTRKDAEAAFVHLCRAVGKGTATSYNDVGAWTLDYNATYGGAVVAEIVNDGGGQSHPLGDRRMSPREFCAAAWFAIRAIDARNDGR